MDKKHNEKAIAIAVAGGLLITAPLVLPACTPGCSMYYPKNNIQTESLYGPLGNIEKIRLSNENENENSTTVSTTVDGTVNSDGSVSFAANNNTNSSEQDDSAR